MKKNKFINKNKQYNLFIALWLLPFLMIELLLLFNLIFKVNKDNVWDFIFSILLVCVIFIPGIVISFVNKKNNAPKKSIWNFLFQAGFVCLAFVGLVEASFDSNLTTKQVKNLISIIQGENNKVIHMESFEVVIKDEKEIYEIDDIILFDISYKPNNATLDTPLYKIDNDIIEIDIYNKKIKCLENGVVNIHFYTSNDESIYYDISLTIDSLKVTDIQFNESVKDIILDINETYQLAKPTIYPAQLSDEKITYSSSKESVVVVDENGIITALKAGMATITCRAGDKEDTISVVVGGFTTLDAETKSITVLPSYTYRSAINLYIDNSAYVKESYFKFEYDEELDIDVWYSKVNKINNFVVIEISNNDESILTNKTFTLIIKYIYPGGTLIEEEVEVILKPYDDITVDDIDFSKTELENEFTIYKDNDEIITQNICIPIYYESLSKKNIHNYKYVSSELNMDFSTYDMIEIDSRELNISQDTYIIKFYPSSNIDEYVEFVIKLNILNISSAYSGFEMNKLYEVSENKKNEIWYSNFNKELFTDVMFYNFEFNNSGLVIIPSTETLEYITLETSDLGIIKSIDFKQTNKLNIPKSCTLEFSIYSLYESNHNPDYTTYTYIIDIITDYDKLEVSIGNTIVDESLEITLKENVEVSIEYMLQVDLEHKGSFQNVYNNGICNITIKDSSIAYVEDNILNTYKPGITTITIEVSNQFDSKLEPINITLNVTDEYGKIPIEDGIVIQIESYPDLSKPNLKENYISTNTVLKLSMEEGTDYTFISSDSSVLVIAGNNTATSIKSGVVTIVAQNNQDPTISYSYELTVYPAVYDFTISKGKFKSISNEGTHYTIYLKTNNLYKIDLSKYFEDLDYRFEKYTDSSNFELDAFGNILIKEDGTYAGAVILGDNDSPYNYKVTFTLISTDDGLASTFLYFIRKAVGHFGLFMVTGIFAFIVLLFLNIFKIKSKIIQILTLLIFGPLLAYTTELIQKLTPTRYYSLDDVKIDSYGYLTGVILVLILYLIVILVKYFLNKIKRNKENGI